MRVCYGADDGYSALLPAGILVVFGGVGGFLLAGILNKKMSLNVEQKLRAMFIIGIISLVGMSMFAVQCDVAPLADTSSYHHQFDDAQ